MKFIYLFIVSILLTGVAVAQSYQNEFGNRQMFWSELSISYAPKGKWSFQLDQQYRRQAADVGTRDWNIFRFPMQQVFRPWIHYQATEAVQLSLTPIGFWWEWDKTLGRDSVAFSREIRVIPQVQISRKLRNGSRFVQRYRAEMRWPSASDSLFSTYVFVSDGESPIITSDNYNMRFRALTRWVVPVFRRSNGGDTPWSLTLSTEPMVVWTPGRGFRFNQNRSYIALGRSISKRVSVDLGYLNQFVLDKEEKTRIRKFQFNNALQFELSVEFGPKS